MHEPLAHLCPVCGFEVVYDDDGKIVDHTIRATTASQETTAYTCAASGCTLEQAVELIR